LTCLTKTEKTIIRKVKTAQKKYGMAKVSQIFKLKRTSFNKPDLLMIANKRELEAVKNLIRKGYLYEPRPDYLKTTD